MKMKFTRSGTKVYLLLLLLLSTVFSSRAQVIATFAGNHYGDGLDAGYGRLGEITGLAKDASGNLFVADYTNSRVRKVNSSGIISTYAGIEGGGYSGDGGPATSAALYYNYGIALDGAGNTYIADELNNVVRKINAAGVISTFAGTGTGASTGDGGLATAASLDDPTSITIDAAGNIYIGGSDVVRKVNTSGIISTVAGPGLGWVTGVMVDASGNLIIVSRNAIVYKMDTSGTLSTIAGDGTVGYTGDSGPATAAQLGYMQGGAIDAAGNIYLPDWWSNVVRKISPSGTISTFAGDVSATVAGDGGPATSASLNGPESVMADAAGNIYIGCANGTVRKVNISGIISTIVGGNLATGQGFSGDGNALLASIPGVSGVAADRVGNVYVTSADNHRVFKVSNGMLTTIAGNGNERYLGDGGPASLSEAAYPGGIAVDTVGNIYFEGVDIGLVRKISADGVISTIGNGYYYGSGSNASVDKSGNVYVSISNRIYKYDVSGTITVFAGTGEEGFSGDGGLATAAKLNHPRQVAFDNSGNVYIADFLNYRIRKITPSGIITTFAGRGVAAVDGDGGLATAAGIYPTSVAIDNAGNVFIGGGNAIRKVDASGILTTYAGGIPSGYYGDGGPASACRFHSIAELAFDKDGRLYIADVGNGVVRVIDAPIAPIGGSGSACVGGTLTLSDGTSGGTWSSSNTAVATIGATGVVSGLSIGTTTITYTATVSGSTYTATKIVTVTNTVAAGAISGSLAVCSSNTTTLTSSITGGTWSSSNTSVATASSLTGVVKGVVAGNATITYTVTNGCGVATATAVVTVNPSFAGPIVGSLYVNVGSTGTLSSWPGGTWSASNSNATVSSSGVVTGITAGTTIVTYALSGSCGSSYDTAVITITPVSPACHSWSLAGGSGISEGYSSYKLIMDAAGTPYIGYQDFDAGMKCVVKRYNGSEWVSLHAEDIPGSPSFVDFAITPSGTLYLMAALDGGYPVYRRTYKYVDNAWVWAASPDEYLYGGEIRTDAAGGVYQTIYAYDETVGHDYVKIEKFNGSSYDDLGLVGYITWPNSHLVLSGTTPYVVFTDAANSDKITVRKYNGSTWENVGTPMSVSSADYPSSTLAVDNSGVAYLCLKGPAGGNVFKYSGTDWTDVSGPLTQILWPNVIMDPSGMPYLVGPSAGETLGTWVMKYDGTTWNSYALAGYYPSDPLGAVDASGNIFIVDNTFTFNLSSSDQLTALKYTAAAGVSPITGSTTVCVGGATTLGNADVAGVWSITDGTKATMDTDPYASGVVHGIASGTTTISYTTGTCSATTILTVGVTGAIGDISGILSVCAGAATTLSDTVAGGTWSSSNTSVATIDSTTGIISGIAAGNATITYALASGCGAATATAVVTVNASPSAGAITGTATICTSNVTTLSNATAGGTWSSSDPTVATIGSATGIVSGVTTGNAIVTYMVTNGCGSAIATKAVTVNAAPSAGTITGVGSLCTGATLTLGNAAIGGTWSSGNTSVATVGSATGIISGVATGNATITYTVANSCGSATAIAVVTVNATPSAGTITGTATVCTGNITTLSNTTTGGAWSSSNTSVATVGSATGIVSGLTAGNATITYTVTSACGSATTTKAVTVNAATSAGTITGAGSICIGATVTLGNTVTGGTWSSSDGAVATVGASSGIVTGAGTGSVTITYTVSGACGSAIATKVVTVGTSASITGSLFLCAGMTSTLSGGASGGTWTSSNTAVATVGASSGVLTAIATGTANITYSSGSGCTAAAVAAVSAPALITGTSTACVGQTSMLTDATAGGTWTSSNTALATVDASTGIVTGVAAGTATISYVVSAGCYRTSSFIVKALPPAVATPVTVCVGGTVSIPPPSSNGLSWTSSNTSVATIGSASGVLTGLSAGTTTLTYTTNTGCFVTTIATVNVVPTITGTTTLCAGSTSSLGCAIAGGNWSSSSTAIAIVGAATGVVTGVSTGTTTITYNTGGCRATTVVSVTPLAAITGTATTCLGATTTLADATAGGTWSSSNAGIASVGTSGIVTGVAAGAANITYTIGSGCTRTVVATVVATSGAISGSLSVCPGSTTSLSAATPGGTWSGGNTAIATINSSTGVVTGVGAGTINVSYTLTGCRSTAIATVNPLPAVIAGTLNACVAQTATLTDATPGGAWSSNNTAIATVDASSGEVMGVAAGTVTMTYTLGSGCYRTGPFTVKALPPAIASPVAACVGTTTSIAPPSSNGKSWSSSNNSVGTIGSSSGILTGVSTGTTTLTYTTTTGCFITTEATVYPIPSAGTITGSSTLVLGNTITLDDAAGGGVWSSSNTARATIGSADGIVTGVGGGTATISYSVSNPGCTVRATMVVHVTFSRPEGNGVTVSNFQLYPNPTTGAFTVEADEAGTFSVFTLDGREVSKHNINSGINQLMLSKELASGIYMCRFTSESGNTTMVRLVFER